MWTIVPWMLLGLCMGAAPAETPWGCVVTGDLSDPERLAVVDLQRYLGQVTGNVPEAVDAAAWRGRPRPAVVVGTPEANPLLEGRVFDVGDEGYRLEEGEIDGARVVVTAGNTAAGATNAVYGLLRELGFGFYLGSEAIPESIPEGLPRGAVTRKPALAVRGVLPWYNFFNSPTAWDPVDHRAFVDQLIRMGANFVGFHTYDYEPFAAYEEGGVYKVGEPLLNTGKSTWGTHPLKTSEFAYGTGDLFQHEFFGAETTQRGLSRNEQIRREQEVMRDALDYAKMRGLRTCLGFECSGDPLDPAVREVFLKRVNHILDQYPGLDYVWIWQAEAQGATGFRTASASSTPLARYALARREAFRRIVERRDGPAPFFQADGAGALARALEGARLEQFALLAYRALAHRAQGPRLVISGWGGDDRLLSAEYYEGLDQLLPKDVVFASLDFIVPRERVDAIYGELPPDRERWPIPWLEYDGDQWHPQPAVHVYEKMMADIRAKGCQGVLGIHWRTRDIEENMAYMVQSAWEPGLTAEAFFEDYARRCYGAELAAPLAEIHLELDRMGYRWVGGGGQAECAPFTWGPGEAERDRALAEIEERLRRLPPGDGSARRAWLESRIEFVRAYQIAETAAVKARALLDAARTADPAESRRCTEEARRILDGGALARALHAYAAGMTTRGEYGVLATMNTKAVVAWRGLRAECFALLGEPDPGEPVPEDLPALPVLHPRFLGSVSENSDLELWPIVVDSRPAVLRYRPLGETSWKTAPLEPVAGAVRRGVVPAAAIRVPGFEIAIAFADDLERSVWGPVAVTAMPCLPLDDGPRPVVAPAAVEKTLAVEAREGETMPVELSWDFLPEADLFRVYRDEGLVAETAVPYFPDAPPAARCRYRVEAWRDGACLAASTPVDVSVTVAPVAEAPEVTVSTNRAGAVLTLHPLDSPRVADYEIVCRSAEEGEDGSGAVLHVPGVLFEPQRIRIPLDPGTYAISVRGRNAAGEPGPAADLSVEFAPGPPPSPVLDLALTEAPADGEITGSVEFRPDGARFLGGWITLPARPEYELGTGMTLDFAFRADRVDGMPVLLGNGQWQADGWFVQILDGKLLLRAVGGDAVGPRIEAGRDYAVRIVYDGVAFHLRVNGETVPQPEAAGTVRPLPAGRELVIGNYSAPGDTYTFHGRLADVRLWSDALPDDE